MMHWKSLADFLAMGGYAFYIWTSMGATVLCLAWEMLALRSRRAQAIKGLQMAKLTDENES